MSGDPIPPGLVERIDDLSVHVELELLGRRRCPFGRAGSPRTQAATALPLRQPALSRGPYMICIVGVPSVTRAEFVGRLGVTPGQPFQREELSARITN